MSESAIKSIRLMVNRQERTILVRDIVYAQVEDKLCTIYLVSHPPFSLFLSIASLKAMLPKEQFLQISRNCLVALRYLQNINTGHVILTNGIYLPYSRRQKTAILHTFQNHLSAQAVQHENYQWSVNLFEEFRCFDHSPIPFCIIEVVSDSYYNRHDYFFRYANEALGALLRTPLRSLINTSFYTAISQAEPRWAQIFTQCSMDDVKIDTYVLSSVTGHLMRVVAYRAHYGFCGCILLDSANLDSEAEILQITS